MTTAYRRLRLITRANGLKEEATFKHGLVLGPTESWDAAAKRMIKITEDKEFEAEFSSIEDLKYKQEFVNGKYTFYKDY